jgi:hypothetical protein
MRIVSPMPVCGVAAAQFSKMTVGGERQSGSDPTPDFMDFFEISLTGYRCGR